uniref:RHS repeat-associated core domain-containing protein n=1 Tax=Escherichia coli TaxID=562 RepID=UPI0018E501E6
DQLLEIRRRRPDAGETDAPEIIRFSYDRLGRMLSEETAQGILTHQYDELSNRTATTFPDGRTQRHLYYGSGHLQQINLDREVISEFTRDHLHREVLRSQGRLSTRQLYDPGGRLKRRETYSGMRGVVPETFTDRQYSYSGEDELLKTRHSRRGETDYFYDTTGRITACRSEDEGYLASWEYDAAGNLLDRRAGGRATAENSVVPFNRLMSYRGVHYRYDEFGRAVEKEGRSGTQSYRYDAEHRMVEVTTARETYRYVYDALGRRTEKQHISPDGKPYNRTKFLWDGMRLAQENRPEGISSLYIYSDPGSYEPLARVDKAGKEGPNRILYFHTDVNGAPEEMTDSDGKIVWETGYQVWGNTIQEKDHGGVEQNLRYQGQYLDRETGLHYNLHRYYDPDVGRFMVTDPISLAGGINLYQYAPNPLSWIDPLGLTVTPLNKEGFYVYGLYKPGATEPYYVGHTEQNPLKREGQHAGTGRLGDAELRILKGEDGKLTYSQAKGYEQAYREKYKTKTGFPGNVIEPIDKSRTDSRGRSHYRNYRAAAREIGIKPTKSRGCI